MRATVFLLSSLAAWLPLLANDNDQFPIIREGKPVSVIAVPWNAQRYAFAADQLADGIEKMCGTRPLVIRDIGVSWRERAGSPYAHVIFIGANEPGPGEVSRFQMRGEPKLSFDELPDDGFVIQTNGAARLDLAGKTPLATEYAVYHLLQKYGGVRWYMPGELGEHIPSHEEWVIPPVQEIHVPSFESRWFSEIAAFDGGLWERRNFVRGAHDFHHHIDGIFPAELFDRFPDYFPADSEGKRNREGALRKDGKWQPCYSNAGAALHAADMARRAFDTREPRLFADGARLGGDLKSFSIGMGDRPAFCQCSACQQLIDYERAVNNHPDASNLYFTFANRVAEELSRTHPNHYLGGLAYGWAETPPEFDVHPNFIPYICADRSQWVNPETKRWDQQWVRDWARVSKRIGVYDYMYGGGMVIPRFYPRLMAESLKFFREQGVVGFYGEIYSVWSLDGPKQWLAAQLLWDVNQDVDVLLRDYYQNFFGSAAAPMQAYFEMAERAWMTQPLKKYDPAQDTVAPFLRDPSQLELFPPSVCTQARRLLDQALAQAESDAVRRRVQFISDGFRQTELWSKAYFVSKDLSASASAAEPALPEPVVEKIDQFISAMRELNQHRSEVLFANPLHVCPTLDLLNNPRYSIAARCASALSALAKSSRDTAQWTRTAEALGELAARLQREPLVKLGPDYTSHDIAQMARAKLTGRLGPELLQNTSFEESGQGSLPAGWSSWIREGTTAVLERSDELAHSGRWSLKVTDTNGACVLMNDVPVEPGRTYELSTFVKAKVGGTKYVHLACRYLVGEQRQDTYGSRSISQLSPESSSDDWQLLTLNITIPNAPSDASKITAISVFLGVSLQQPGEYAYFDDVSMREVLP